MRRINSILFFVILTSGLFSCIEPFTPNLGNQATPKYVVSGQITDREGYQTVSISTTSSISQLSYNPLSNCKVTILDNHGNVFNLVENEKGFYSVWMDKEFLIPGNSYKVNVLTESGVEIESVFDTMPVGPEIDSIYYVREGKPTTDPNKPQQGVQFYVDVDGKNTNSHYFRWEIIETWEHHAVYPRTWYWTGYVLLNTNPPDYSKFYCWSTKIIGNFFTLSTYNLVQNKYRMHKLHYVDNQTQRLTYCYSLLVNQYAQSEQAYLYWDKLRANSNEHGGLYDTQPIQVQGNLKSLSNPELNVLGFFGAYSVRSKRIFVRNVENLETFQLKCDPREREKGEPFRGRPSYLIDIVGINNLYIMEAACVECNYFGGSTVKPDYWPY